MKNDTISKAIWLAIGFAVAGLFIAAAVGIIAHVQGDAISFIKHTENY